MTLRDIYLTVKRFFSGEEMNKPDRRLWPHETRLALNSTIENKGARVNKGRRSINRFARRLGWDMNPGGNDGNEERTTFMIYAFEYRVYDGQNS
jgi:hypothetical protein